MHLCNLSPIFSKFSYFVFGIGVLGQFSLLKCYVIDVAIIPVGYGNLYPPASLLRSVEAVTSFTVNELQQAATRAVRQPQELLPVTHVKTFVYINCKTKLDFGELHLDLSDILQLL